ncbi:MAG: bifunctional pyr operon transcriptional regulator/uracil phosphoribosyltransferase PyrR [Gammaproteobacteria bacterium]|nr:bifunctional pyr operon transcriptional regulator/uracil phosphoribosyltransferase PyrR [Gammaproteobacteria bacterium]
MILTSVLLNEKDISRAITRITHEILEKNKGAENVAIVGIRTRGVTLAKRIHKKINEIEGIEVDFGVLDITLYRDDLAIGKQNPIVEKTQLPFHLEGKNIILIDDVLFTGRTIRAAIDALIDFGRPDTVQLGVLIDRGHRELPIRPDYVGKNIPTAKPNRVQVRMLEDDSRDEVSIMDSSNSIDK